jgi:prevent-host-death family protein
VAQSQREELVMLLDHLLRRATFQRSGGAMTCQINIAEAKAKLSELLDRALAGEEVVIARAGKPLVRLVPVEPRQPRKKGAWRGWAADIPTEVFLEPMDPKDLDAAEGKFSDEFGISLPRSERT